MNAMIMIEIRRRDIIMPETSFNEDVDQAYRLLDVTKKKLPLGFNLAMGIYTPIDQKPLTEYMGCDNITN